jgi:general secretion pathway protein G
MMYRKADGFTLIELLVVLAILALLAGIVGPQVMKSLGVSKTKCARVQIEDFGAALDLYRLDVGRYPKSDEGLEALVKKSDNSSKWNGPYLKKSEIVKDPWGYDYIYRAPGENGPYDIYSLGGDNTEGGDGEDQDIKSWE